MTTAKLLEETSCPVRVFTRPSTVRAWLREANIRPNRLLGQNFLIDGNILEILLHAAAIDASDRVLEIGPGLGALTAGVLARGAYVVAIEKDARLLPLLEKHILERTRLHLVEGDALDLAEPLIRSENIQKVVANLPYTPGTRILVDLVTSQVRPSRIAVMVQDEVAGRITAAPGKPAFGLLSLWCRVFYDVAYVKRVSPNCFWPRPQVQSAIVRMERLPCSLIPHEGWPFFRMLTRLLFQQRRKQLGHLLAALHPGGTGATEAALALLTPEQLRLRPEALPLDVWCALSENMRMHLHDNQIIGMTEGGLTDGW